MIQIIGLGMFIRHIWVKTGVFRNPPRVLLYSREQGHLSCIVRKPVCRVSSQVGHKLGCTAIENGKRLEILDFGSTCREIFFIYVAKTKALISCVVICPFALHWQKNRFSHEAAHLCCTITKPTIQHLRTLILRSAWASMWSESS